MNRKKSIIYTATVIALISVLLTSFSLKGCFSKTLSRTFFAADTVCTITLYDGNEDALNGAVELCNSLANKLNCKDESSEVGRLNKEKSAPNPSFELLNIVASALYYCDKSDGAFDITVKPLSDLWDFKNETLPSDAEITEALKKVNYRNLVIKNNAITLKNNAEVDFGAIAKGFIANEINKFLTEKGVKSAVINLGGNITVIGKKDGENYNIGIQKPFGKGNATLISCNDTSVVTSGIYQRYFEKEGKIYHHLLNTKTGYPEQNGLYSVTIISKSATSADALSTLCFLKGLDEGMKLIENTKNVEAVFIDSNQRLHLSSGLKINGNLIEIK